MGCIISIEAPSIITTLRHIAEAEEELSFLEIHSRHNSYRLDDPIHRISVIRKKH